ncbi:MAG: hypothetical protein LM550_02935 [Candidatus Contendobacter sp.]|jgi:hypothetical protein|nr:hypothetical protein [Candidatus Contendobacter sp.]
MRDLIRKLNTYRLEIAAMLAALANFGVSIDINNFFSMANLKFLPVLFFFATIVVIITKIHNNLDQIKGFISTASLFIKNVARPSNEEVLLEYVLRMGTFHVIDTQFWIAYALELKNSGAPCTDKVKKVLAAIDTNTITVHKEAVYRLMHKLLMIVIENDETYYGTATVSELQNADNNANIFLLQLPLQYPGKIVRIIFLDNENQLPALSEQIRQALKSQLEKGVQLYIDSNIPPQDRLNFGVYGTVAVGKYDEASGLNKLVFDRDVVATHKTKFTNLLNNFGTARKLNVHDLGL